MQDTPSRRALARLSRHTARPGIYILFKAHVSDEAYTYIDAYRIEGQPLTSIIEQLGIDDESYAIAWCPSRNQAQKAAHKNWEDNS